MGWFLKVCRSHYKGNCYCGFSRCGCKLWFFACKCDLKVKQHLPALWFPNTLFTQYFARMCWLKHFFMRQSWHNQKFVFFSYYSVLWTRQEEFHIRKAHCSPSSLINTIGHSALIDTSKAINSLISPDSHPDGTGWMQCWLSIVVMEMSSSLALLICHNHVFFPLFDVQKCTSYSCQYVSPLSLTFLCGILTF